MQSNVKDRLTLTVPSRGGRGRSRSRGGRGRGRGRLSEYYSAVCVKTKYMRVVHKISFPLVPQLVNHLLREATVCT